MNYLIKRSQLILNLTFVSSIFIVGCNSGDDFKAAAPSSVEKNGSTANVEENGPLETPEQPTTSVNPKSNNVRPSDQCDVPKGEEVYLTRFAGEDVPGNQVDGGPYGGDFDDFGIQLSGFHVIQKKSDGAYAKIGFTSKTTLNVKYARGTSDCAHSFKFILRKCPNVDSTPISTHDLNVGRGVSGELSIPVTQDDSFLDIEITTSATSTNDFGGCKLSNPVVNLLYGGPVPLLVGQ